MMLTLSYEIRFHTPAFLGNAEQSGQWRTPPIKALLRQWWRVVYAAEHAHRVDVSAMRRDEGWLFGVATDGEAQRSQIRLRLSRWDLGALKGWAGLERGTVEHPEVERTGYKVGPHAYLGMGPLDGRGGTRFSDKCNAAIQAQETATLSLAVLVDAEAARVQRALALMNLYGTLGGRSRNGWGSISLNLQGATPSAQAQLSDAFTLPWRTALRSDWPQGIGVDDRGPLVWQTKGSADWQKTMVELARIKIALRTQQAFRFPNERPDGQIHSRHWLSYPVTNHDVSVWKRDGLRLPNSLRFKVRPDADGRLRGVIFHMPCLPPPAFRPEAERSTIERVWQHVHAHLDADASLQRIAA